MKKENIKKILIIRLGAIGDLLHSSEVFRSIKRKYPQTEIHYLTTKMPAQIIENDKDIDKIIIAENKTYKYLWNLAKEIRKNKYDLILNLQPSNRTKFLCLCSLPKNLVTYKKTFKLHAVENFWQTAQKFYKNLELKHELELQIPQETIEKVQNSLPQNAKIVTMNIFTSPTRQGRRWRKEYYKELALKLIEKYGCYVVFSGAPDEAEELNDFKDLHSNIIILAGKLSLLESCALYSLSDIMISSDTGPLHLATGTQKPVCIGLFGGAPISRTGVWGMKHFAICADLPCIACNRRKCKIQKGQYNPCLDAIKVDDILNIIQNDIWTEN